MIYFTTFILTLLISHIARAVPACGDVPEDLYDPTYDDSDGQLVFATYNVTWDAKYDNPNGNTSSVACSNGPHGLAGTYPYFKNFPDFPFLGGAFDTKWGSSNCGKCWRLLDKESSRGIYVTAIDAAGSGFNIGKDAFIGLNGGGTVGSGTLKAEAESVAGHFCRFK